MGGPLIGTSGAVSGIVTVGDVRTVAGETLTGERFAAGLDNLGTTFPTTQGLWGVLGAQEPSLTADADSSSVSGKPLDDDAAYGRVLQVAYTQEASSFSTWENDEGVGPQAMHPLHNMLIQPRTWGSSIDFSDGAFFELRPDLATGWQVSADGLEYAFSLRNNLAWSDGTPITCNDVKWSFDTIRTGEGLEKSPQAAHFNKVEATTCADDLTVVFVLNDHHPTILEAISLPQNIIRPAHVYEGNNFALLRDEIPTVTSGPYESVERIPGESYRFERNDDYWDAPFPYLDGVATAPYESSGYNHGHADGQDTYRQPGGIRGSRCGVAGAGMRP